MSMYVLHYRDSKILQWRPNLQRTPGESEGHARIFVQNDLRLKILKAKLVHREIISDKSLCISVLPCFIQELHISFRSTGMLRM